MLLHSCGRIGLYKVYFSNQIRFFSLTQSCTALCCILIIAYSRDKYFILSCYSSGRQGGWYLLMWIMPSGDSQHEKLLSLKKTSHSLTNGQVDLYVNISSDVRFHVWCANDWTNKNTVLSSVMVHSGFHFTKGGTTHALSTPGQKLSGSLWAGNFAFVLPLLLCPCSLLPSSPSVCVRKANRQVCPPCW